MNPSGPFRAQKRLFGHRRSLAFGGAALVAAVLAYPEPAHAVIVEKVVAVVGDAAILLSDLDHRSQQFLRQVVVELPAGPRRAAAISQLHKDLLNKLIEEELEAQSAERQKLEVKPEEIDKALKSISEQQNKTISEVIAENIQKTGSTETDFRAEIKRQLLEGKLLNQRIRGRIRMTEDDLKAAYVRALKDERERSDYHPAWIVLRLLPGSSPEAIAERRTLAKRLVNEARGGVDFAELARTYSDETNSKDKGGDLGIRAPQKTMAAQTGKRDFLSEEFEKAVFPLDPGDISDPIDAGDGIVIIKLLSRQPSRYTTFEDARDEMVGRVQNELLQKEKDDLIEELKRRTHVDPRL